MQYCSSFSTVKNKVIQITLDDLVRTRVNILSININKIIIIIVKQIKWFFRITIDLNLKIL